MFIETPKIDKRSFEDLLAEMKLQYLGLLPEPEWQPKEDDPGLALIKIYAHMAEEVIDRLNRVPRKYFAAFLSMLGISRLPAAAALVPVTFFLSAGTDQHVLIPKGTAVAAGEKEVVFETRSSFLATPAKPVKAFVVVGEKDKIYPLPLEPGKGAEPAEVENLQAHILYLGHEDLFNFAGVVKFELTGLYGPFEGLIWEYAAAGWRTFDKVYKQNGKLILEKNNDEEIEKLEINGTDSRWIRCTAESADLKQALRIEAKNLKVALLPQGKGAFSPDTIFCNDIPVDISSQEIVPFGTLPGKYDTFYIASREAFSKKNAGITLHFNITNAENIIKNEKLRLSWEYGSGIGWQVIKGIQSVDNSNGDYRFWDSGTVSFTCPGDIEPVHVEGQENYWIRVRIIDGDYGKEMVYDNIEKTWTQGEIKPPIISTITVSYDYETGAAEPAAATEPQHCITYNNLEYKDLKDKPFYPMEDQQLALYLGFDKKIQKGPVSMYFSLAAGENGQINETKVEWYYAGEKDWQVLQAVDFTRSLTESGTVEFFFAPGFTCSSRFGEKLYWIKAVSIAREMEQSIKTAKIYPNTCMAAQVEKVEEEILGSSGGEANQVFRISRFPVISEEIWIDESRTLTEEGKRAISTELGEDSLREIKEEGSDTTAVLVRWQAAADFLASSSRARHYVIDRAGGNVYFGDGVRGKIPPIGTDNIKVCYYVGGGATGNVEAGEIADLRRAIPYVDSVVNPEPARGGADTEQMGAVFKRGPYIIRHRNRAVTGEDFERAAFEVSAYITRSRCIIQGNQVVLIVLPGYRSDKPMPTPSLKKRVKGYLLERCPAAMVPANIVVKGPQYVAAAVRAGILAESVEAAAVLEAKILAELCSFLHPLTGGPEGEGWEFGRSLYISDVYALLEGIDGVDHVENLWLNGEKKDVVLTKEDQILCSGEHKITIKIGGR